MAIEDHDERHLASFEINLPVNEAKMADIKRCLEKGKLRITLEKVNLASGRLGDGYLYD